MKKGETLDFERSALPVPIEFPTRAHRP